MTHSCLRVVLGAVLLCGFGAQLAPAQVTLRRDVIERLARTGTPIVRNTGTARVDTVTASRQVVLDRRQILATVDTEAPVTRPPSDPSRLHLPIFGVAEVGGTAREFQVVVEAGPGLQYDHRANQFSGRIHMGLEDTTHGAARGAAFDPLQLQVFGVDSVDPSVVSLDHIDVPFRQVVIASRTAGDTLEIRVRPRGNPAVTFGIPVRRVPLRMNPDRQRVGGLGVDEVTLQLPFPEEFGGDSLEVVLEGDGVRASPPSLMLHRASAVAASATVRSAGLGRRVITARGPFYTSAVSVDLQFAPPWSFIVAALLGGALAAIVREALRKGVSGSRRRFLVAGLMGAFFGFVICALFVNGINVAGVPIAVGTSELLVFAIAALGGLGGVEALGRAVPSLGHLLATPSKP